MVSGGIGYFVEYVGMVIEKFLMEVRMMVCNMSIEMGVWGGMIVLDEKIFEYVKGKKFVF